MKEIWKDINKYENRYQISNFGRVKSLGGYRKNGRYYVNFKDKIMNPGKKKGKFYYIIQLHKNNIRKYFTIHRLVARHFIKNKNNLPQVNHIDGNKINNNVFNLEWCDASHNVIHSNNLGLNNYIIGEINGMSKLKEKQVLEIRKLYKKGNIFQKDLAIKFNVSKSNIYFIVNNKTWRYLK